MASYQGLYAKFVSMISPKFSIVEDDVDFDGASRTLSATAAIFSSVLIVFGFSRPFLSLFFNKITNIRSWRCFSASKIHTQFSHTFCNITMIFKVMSQYFPALFKRIHKHIRSAEGLFSFICQIRHDLSVIIHGVSIYN